MKKRIRIIMILLCMGSMSGCVSKEEVPAQQESTVINELIQRVNQNVEKVGKVELNSKNDNGKTLLKLLMKAYPQFTYMQSAPLHTKISCGVTLINQICDNRIKNTTPESRYALSTSHPILNQTFEAKKNIMSWELTKDIPVSALAIETKKRTYNTICDYEVKNAVYRLESKPDYPLNPSGDTVAMNYLFLNCPGDEDLKKQLTTLQYELLTRGEQMHIEQYLYVMKVFLNAEVIVN